MTRPRIDVQVREATPDDYPAVAACMTAVFEETGAQKAAWFNLEMWKWQYTHPDWPALVVVADVGGRIGGYYHILPLAIRRAGRDTFGGLMQDIGTLAEYRGRGVFGKMVNFGLERMRERGTNFLYGFPNERSRSNFERNHQYAQFTRIPVYIAPLAPFGVVARRLRVPAVGAALDRLLRPALGAWLRRQAAPRAGESVERVAAADEEIAVACRDFHEQRGIHLVRSPGYLMWRFFDKPNGEYEGWVLRRGGVIEAFTIVREAELFGARTRVFMEFGCRRGHEDALRRLIASRMVAAQGSGAQLAITMGLHPFFDDLGTLGFVRVPERFNPKPFNIIVKNPAGAEAPDLIDASQWGITLSDWDVM